MTRIRAWLPPAVQIAALIPTLAATLAPAEAETRKVQVPNRYDGTWQIVATTTVGPCAASASYQVLFKDGEATIPGQSVDIEGGVSAGGAVQATIIQGSSRAPIAGSLDAGGSGAGTWRTTGGLVACSGNWRAKRAG